MLKRGRVAQALVIALVLLHGAAAWAQLGGGLQVIVSPAGVTIEGSITIDGVTWSGDEVLQIARDVAADSRNLPPDLPPPVHAAVAEAMAALRGAGGAP